MAYDGTLKFDTALDASGLQKGATKLGDIVKGLGLFKIIEKGMGAVVSSIDSAVSRVDTLNKFPRVMEQMGYGADNARASMEKLSDGIEGLPTTLDGIVGSTQRLAIATGSLDTGTDTALALNNALLASGASSEAASRGTEQYIQALSRGKIDAQEWKTLMETMPYAMDQVAQAFGFTGPSAVQQLQAALGSGNITMVQFNDRLIELNGGMGGFAEVAQTASGGIATSWANVQTAVVKGTAGVIQAVDSGLAKFGGIAGVMDSVKGAVNTAFTAIASGANVLMQNLEPITAGVIAFSVAWKGTQLLSYVGQLGSLTKALAAMHPKIVAATAAKLTDTKVTASAAGQEILLTTAIIAESVAKGANAVATNLSTAADNGNVLAKIALAVATKVAAAATWLFNAALAANPIGLVIVAVVALTAAIIGLVAWLSNSSAEYKKQKEEVKALTEAQEALAASTEESADAYKSNAAEIAASGKVAKSLVGTLKDVSSSTASADEKSRRMSSTVDQLNAAVDGLNIAYDEETGAIRNVNTGQEISLDQLEQLVAAKAELAQANAWQARANELVREQVQIQEDLAVIEAKKQEIMENSNLSTREQEKLIKELDEAAAGHATTMEEVDQRLGIVNDNIAASDTSMAESIVASHENIGRAVTESGESIEDVAAQWNVSVDDILAAMERENISLDEWVTKQQDAWADYEESVKERTKGVINSFKEIPGEYDKSATEMLEILQNNKLRYAEWEAAMEEITRQLGPTAAEEFAKLGPEATSAMQEILGSAELLDEYREVFGVKIDEATGTAVENWNDPNFIGAPSTAIDTSAQLVTENTALAGAVTQQMEGAKAAAEAVDFSEVGQNIAADIVGGLNSADVNGAMQGIASAIQSNTGKVTSAISSMSTSVLNLLRNMKSQAANVATQTMTEINSAIVTRSNTVKSSVTSMGNGVITSLNTMRTQAANVALQMMTDINSAIVSRTSTIRASATAAANSVVSGLQPMVSGGENVASNMMDGIGAAMDRKAPSLYAKAREIANRIAAIMADALDVHSPSRVMIRLFENVMLGIYEGMDRMSGMLYREAESIADGIADRLTISKDVANALVEQMRTITNSTPLGGVALVPQMAAVGAGGGARYITSLTQNITTPKPLSPSEMTREGQDLLRRTRWQLP